MRMTPPTGLAQFLERKKETAKGEQGSENEAIQWFLIWFLVREKTDKSSGELRTELLLAKLFTSSIEGLSVRQIEP